MHSRLVLITHADNIDNGIAYLRDHVVRTLQEQKGYRGLTAGADRAAHVLEIITFWDTAADREASESVAGKLRHEALQLIDGVMSVEKFDDIVCHFTEPPLIGSCEMVTRIKIDPARLDEHRALFRNDVLARMKETPGYRSACRMVSDAGHGIVCSEWKDEASMQAWAADARPLRRKAASRGVTFGDTSVQEVLFADLAEDLLSTH